MLEGRVGMYTLTGSFGEVCAYLYGFDAGVGDGALASFQAWLLERETSKPELAIPSIVLETAFPDGLRSHAGVLTTEENAIAVAALFKLLKQHFLDCDNCSP
jgi:hypothetical protein